MMISKEPISDEVGEQRNEPTMATDRLDIELSLNIPSIDKSLDKTIQNSMDHLKNSISNKTVSDGIIPNINPNKHAIAPVPISMPNMQELDVVNMGKSNNSKHGIIDYTNTNSDRHNNLKTENIMNILSQSRSIPNSPVTVNCNGSSSLAKPKHINGIASSNSMSNLNLRGINRTSTLTPSLSISSSNADSTSNQVRLFQRMDELSARLITMEDQFQNLSTKIEQYSVTMQSIKSNLPNILQSTITEQFKIFQKQNEIFLHSQFQKMNDNMSTENQQTQPNNNSNQSNFIIELLNSISSISSNYLNNFNGDIPTSNHYNMNSSLPPNQINLNHSVTSKPSKFTSLSSSASNPQHVPNNNNSPSLFQLPSFTNRNKTFTLNPNGIKKRKRHHNHHNHHHTDMASQDSNKVAKTNNHSNSQTNNHTNVNATDVLNMPITLPPDPFAALTSMDQNSSNGVNGDPVHMINNSTVSTGSCLNNINTAAGTRTTMDIPLSVPTSHGPPSTQQPISAISLPLSMQLPLTQPSQSLPNQQQKINKPKTDDVIDEDGYQEDDEDDDDSNKNDSVYYTKTQSTVGAPEDEEEEDEEEEDDDDEEYDEDDEELPMSHGETSGINKDDEEEGDGDNEEEDEVDEDMSTVNDNTGLPKKKLVKKAATGKKKKIMKQVLQSPQKTDKSKPNNADSHYNSNEINYTLIKAPNNVRTIWEEYVYGINGSPSIRGLEEKYGNKWRLTKNRKTFSRRKRLYKFILNGIDKGKTAEEMVKALEEKRLYKDENGEVKRRTVGWLQQSLTGI